MVCSIGLIFSQGRINLLSNNSEIVFFQIDESEFLPHLVTFNNHKNILPKIQVDRGAIKFVIQGADIMAPGLLSSGGVLPPQLKKDQFVVFN